MRAESLLLYKAKYCEYYLTSSHPRQALGRSCAQLLNSCGFNLCGRAGVLSFFCREKNVTGIKNLRWDECCTLFCNVYL